jgi:hypothetical protein
MTPLPTKIRMLSCDGLLIIANKANVNIRACAIHYFASYISVILKILAYFLNISEKSCRENQNMYFIFSTFFFRKSYHLRDNVENYVRATGHR